VAVRSEYLELTPVSGGSAKNLEAEEVRKDISSTGGAANGLAARVTGKSFAGGQLRITAVLGNGEEVVASRHGIDSPLRAGEEVRITWGDAAHAVPVDRAGSAAEAGV
jgi:spermidine/putrescine transport system ATP-binding protein